MIVIQMNPISTIPVMKAWVLKSFFFIGGLITGSRRGMAETDVLSVGYYDTVRPTDRF